MLSEQKYLKGKSDAYKSLICMVQRVHFEVRVVNKSWQRFLSLSLPDIVVKKQIECGLAWSVLLSTTSTRHHSGENVADSRDRHCFLRENFLAPF